MKYGLIGGKLGHSHSPKLHTALGTPLYELLELTPDELDQFLRTKEFAGINVTIPYKETVIPYLDEIDARARQIGSVNTIVNRSGILTGYNTDYDGFRYLLDKHNVTILNQKILIIGSGGTSKTVQAVMKDLKAKEIVVVSRSKKQVQNGISVLTYEEIDSCYDADIIINTTPVGMYPQISEQIIDLTLYHCHTVIDVIYNPLQTALLSQAKALKRNAIGGLEMLVAQAVYANALFQAVSHPQSKIHELYVSLYRSLVNFVFIGMPGSGKSSLAMKISQLTNKTMQDMDQLIETQAKQSITQIFRQYGEPHFRELEHTLAASLSSRQNQVISTGGGIIKNLENIRLLQHNGLILFIDRDVSRLEINDKRPLSQTVEANLQLYQERYPLYLKASTKVISNNGNEAEAIQQILEVYHEITSY